MTEAPAQVQAVLSLVKTILQLFLPERVAKRLQIGKLAHCVCIQLINACKSFLTDGFLVVGQEQASELFPLEKVLPMVLGLGHR